MTKPSQLKKDEAWIAIRINDNFLIVNDDPYDVYVLLDAVSAHVYGHVLAKAADEVPQESDVVQLFDKALKAQGKPPKKLIIPENSKAGSVFKALAKKHKIPVEAIPLSQLSPIIAPLIKAFAEDDEEF
ncbi:hypothetical protein JCM14469_10500 [Desulfatiferula olefinivorans]